MQAQTQPQLGQSGGQLGSQANTLASQSGTGAQRGWQTDSDVTMRRMLLEKILQLFQRRRPRATVEWQQRLPDFVKRIEESLYKEATSKEEYADLSTLEQRIQALVKRSTPQRTNPNVAIRGMSSSASPMIPTPGIPPTINGSIMIPTPGTELGNFIGNTMPPSSVPSLQGHRIISTNSVSNMIPTPGISSNAFSGNETSVSTSKGNPMQQQTYGNHMNRNLNGRLAQGPMSSLQQKNPMSFGYVNGNGQHIPNGNLSFPNSHMFMSSGQQQLQHNMSMQHYAHTGNFYNPMSNGVPSNGLRMQSQGFQVSKMIPVPGLPSQQPNSQPQHQSQQSESQTEKITQVNCQQKTLSSAKTSPQQETLKTKLQSDSTNGEKAATAASSVEEHPHSMQQGLVNECHAISGHSEPLVEEQNNMQDQASSLPPKQDNTCSLQEGTISTVQAGSSVDTRSYSIGTTDPQRAQQYMKQQKYLLLLRHASKCTAPEGQCQSTPVCKSVKDLWTHITKCTARNCQHPRCQATMSLVRHHQNCRDTQCPVCVPVKQKILMQRIQASQNNNAQTAAKIEGLSAESSVNKCSDLSGAPAGGLDPQPPPAKRPKVEPVDTMDISEQNTHSASAKPSMSNSEKTEQHTAPVVNVKSESYKTSNHSSGVIKTESQVIRNKSALKMEQNVTNCDPGTIGKPDETGQLVGKSGPKTNSPVIKIEAKVGQPVVKTESKLSQPVVKTDTKFIQTVVKNETKLSQTVVKHELQKDTSSASIHENVNNVKGSKPKIKGVSLTELFTPEQIKEHITGLRQWIGQSKAKAEKNQAMEHKMSESSCQLCAVETLTFEPPPIYCTPCGARIKRNALYWTTQIGETRHYFCAPCVNDPRSDTLDVDGINCPKSKLEKRRNDEETEEPWVLCDKCEKWQHQVCALFNMRRNEGGQAEYTCPHCLIVETEKGERKPLPQSAVLGAKDLPRSILSDHIEQRLARKLKQERHERARAQGKSYDEVPGAESLVVRVVSSVDKKLEVKQRFWEMFKEEDYPKEFPYKSKVLLLFQKIEGVEVCLFGMYVQEFGVEASLPNQRRVYLSYLDSVKYFRPDVKTVHGEALRTFVYHEILIGYLDYCKKRGFTSCYIWACPPLKGEDYILYCHPEIQKTPKSDKLREWYLTMLRKAGNESIVAELTNMYDHFFVCTGESKGKVTAARLPYFDGDYWPGAAEDMIMQLEEEEIGRRQQKKGKTKKTVTKRVGKAGAQPELASNASKDLQLMHKLGETIYPMKEDFIMVHLQFACTHCCNFIISGHRWNCRVCKNFHLCDRCYDAEQKLDDREKHPVGSKEAHTLYAVKLDEEFPDTKDKDEIMESEFFDTRQAFLSLCQGNHYQYDTLRRAKHSSMMVLYHLHNPTAPAFVTTCNLCQRDIETGQGWRCETCPDFDLCNTCYSKDDTPKHAHKLTPHPTAGDRDTQSNEARQQRVVQLRKMLDLLIHASQCGVAQCLYPNCRRVKALFRHGMSCKIRVSGGCPLCKKMWYILQIHARACKESECRVPRCKDLKEHTRRLQRQMESRRRAAVKEMMRQRSAEADGDAT